MKYNFIGERMKGLIKKLINSYYFIFIKYSPKGKNY